MDHCAYAADRRSAGAGRLAPSVATGGRSPTRRRGRLLHVVLGTLLFGATSAAADPALPPPVKVVEYDCPSVGLRFKYAILLPDDYAATPKRYPVVFLLHGYMGNYASWITYARLPVTSATEHGFILVLPDGGNSFYVNWKGSEETRPQRWEDAIAKDLVRHVDSNYRTIPRRDARALGGLSMGGYGALVIGLRNPDVFGTVWSSAGALKAAQEADEYDPYRLVQKTPAGRLPYVHVDCGTEDDGIEECRAFAALFHKLKARYSYLESPGGHAPPYRENAQPVSPSSPFPTDFGTG